MKITVLSLTVFHSPECVMALSCLSEFELHTLLLLLLLFLLHTNNTLGALPEVHTHAEKQPLPWKMHDLKRWDKNKGWDKDQIFIPVLYICNGDTEGLNVFPVLTQKISGAKPRNWTNVFQFKSTSSSFINPLLTASLLQPVFISWDLRAAFSLWAHRLQAQEGNSTPLTSCKNINAHIAVVTQELTTWSYRKIQLRK